VANFPSNADMKNAHLRQHLTLTHKTFHDELYDLALFCVTIDASRMGSMGYKLPAYYTVNQFN